MIMILGHSLLGSFRISMEENMKKRVLIALGIVAALMCTMIIGAAAGGGILYTWLHQVRPAFAAQLTDPDPNAGLIVAFVKADGPASEAGVVRGDILLSIDDKEVNSIADVRETLKDLSAGNEVSLTVLHGDDLRTLAVTLTEDDSGAKLGLTLCCGSAVPLGIEAAEMGKGQPLIIRVLKDTPAEEVGLKPGDLILSIDGEETDSEKSLSEWISQYEPGDQIQLEARNLREDEIRTIVVELGENPENEGKAYLGVQAIQAPSDLSTFDENLPYHDFYFNVPPTDEEGFPFRFHNRDGRILPFAEDKTVSGVIILEVTEDSPADEAGLEKGDVITKMNGEDLQGAKSFADSISAMKPGDKVSLSIYRSSSDGILEFDITLGEHPENPNAGYLGVQIRGIIQPKQSE
jgi:S1-C subfamily serine protease